MIDPDQRSDTVSTEFFPEGFRVVAAVSSEASQVAAVAPDDLQADLRIVFLARDYVVAMVCSVSTSTKVVILSARTR